MDKVIGIISYLPDDVETRNIRKEKLYNLIIKCKSLFHLPIIIIAQNWKNFKILGENCEIYNYDQPLGIVKARNTLREIFLSSKYEYLIMIDDDIVIEGNNSSKYLKQIDNCPNCFIEFNKSKLQLFAISKEIFKKEIFDNINPEKGEGFEDRIFVNKLRIKYPEARRIFVNTELEEHSIATKDNYSTWYKNQDLTKMLNNTSEIINKIK